jgi:ferric enterobactin receptor
MLKRGFILLLLLLLNAAVFSQKITVNLADRPLTEILQYISENYKIKFAYDNDRTDKIIVHKSFSKVSPEEFLQSVLSESGLAFSMINDVYVITPDNTADRDNIIESAVINKKISGLVKDFGTGEHLPYSTVMIANSQTGTLANSDGFFTLWIDSDDSVTLRISFIGYETRYVSVKPKSKNSLEVIEMNMMENEMPAAVVRSAAQQVFECNKTPGSITLNPSKMIDMPALAEQDIVTPLQLMPGIDATTETSSGLSIHKAPSDKNLVLYDGMTIYQIDHFYGMISSFNSKAIKDIEVYKSGFDAKYGGRASSVVEITGKSGNMNKPSVDAGMDMWSVDGMVEVPVVKDKASLILTGRRSYTDYYQSPLFTTLYNKTRNDLQNYYSPQDYLTAFKSTDVSPSLYFYDATAKFTYKPTQKDVISFSWYKGIDRMNFFKSDTGPIFRVRELSELKNQGFSFRWGRKWSDNYYNSFVLGYSDYSARINHQDTSLQRNLDYISFSGLKRYFDVSNSIRDINLNFQNQYQWNNFLSLDFGLSENLYKTDVSYVQIYTGDSSLTKIKDPIQTSEVLYSSLTAGYLQTNFSYGRLTSLKLGLRGNYYSLLHDYRLEPRFSASYRISSKIQGKMSAGVSYQYVNRLSYQSDFRNVWTMADNNSPIVSCRHVMLGSIYEITPTLTLDVEFYYRRMFGLPFGITTYRISYDSINAESKLYINYLIQKTAGVDILLKKIIGPFQSWLAYSFSESNMMYNSFLKKNVQPTNEYFPYSDDQRHEIKFYNTLQQKNWNFSLAWIFGSGKPWNYYELNGEMNYLPYDINSKRLPLYHRMDVGVNYNISIGPSKIKIGMNIFNVYNHHNKRNTLMKLSDKAGLEALTGGKPLQVVDIYGLGFTPNIFLNIKF